MKQDYVFSHFKDGNYVYIFAHREDNRDSVGKLILHLDYGYSRFRHLCNGGKLAYIHRVETRYDCLHKGVATALINKAINMFPEYNLYLWVKPSIRGEKDKNLLQLKAFYSKFGFVRTDELDPTMFRKARL